MPIWLLKMLHWVGLTNLTDDEVKKYSNSDKIKIISCEWVSGHTYRITTESKKYGRVTQNVLLFPGETEQKLSERP